MNIYTYIVTHACANLVVKRGETQMHGLQLVQHKYGVFVPPSVYVFQVLVRVVSAVDVLRQ
jgi:hypothetical protein